MKNPSLVSQFKITLLEVSPRVWRRIQVPADYTFWDLHVAIQDSMGWLDYHLHVFPVHRKGKLVEIGIPMDPADDPPFVAGWRTTARQKVMVSAHLSRHRIEFI